MSALTQWLVDIRTGLTSITASSARWHLNAGSASSDVLAAAVVDVDAGHVDEE